MLFRSSSQSASPVTLERQGSSSSSSSSRGSSWVMVSLLRYMSYVLALAVCFRAGYTFRMASSTMDGTLQKMGQQLLPPSAVSDQRRLQQHDEDVTSTNSSNQEGDHNNTSSSTSTEETSPQPHAVHFPSYLLPKLPEQPSWLVVQQQEEQQELNFVHIPKTGGSSIVQAAMDAGLNWGDCLFRGEWPGPRICPHKPAQEWPFRDPHRLDRVWWHVPLQYLPQGNMTTEEQKNSDYQQSHWPTNPYANKDLFAVMRNPYDRAVSEFFYHCKVKNKCKELFYSPKDAVRSINSNLQVAMQSIQKAAATNTSGNSKDYFFHWGHWVPQYDYFYDNADTRLVKHLLHTEFLQDEFESLTAAYNLTHVRLPASREKLRNTIVADGRPLGVENLTRATLQMIEQVYAKDFALGGYPMISHMVLGDSVGVMVESSSSSTLSSTA